jgi:hypothetical protein
VRSIKLVNYFGGDGAELEGTDATKIVDHDNHLLSRLDIDVGAIAVGLIKELLEHGLNEAFQGRLDAAKTLFVVNAHTNLDFIAKLIGSDFSTWYVNMS